MSFKKLLYALGILIVGFLLLIIWPQNTHYDLYSAKPGQPLPGLTGHERDIFARGKALFEHEFTADEGLGPLFNGRSCYECHGKPLADGMQGQNPPNTGVKCIGRLMPDSVLNKDLQKARQEVDGYSFDRLVGEGGPVLRRHSITSEFAGKFPPDCKMDVPAQPSNAQFMSWRQAGPLLGSGLIEAVGEQTIVSNMIQEAKLAPKLVGHLNAVNDPLTRTVKIGRFGWKGYQPDLLLCSAEELFTQMGITSYVRSTTRSGMPECLLENLPHEPNDNGAQMACLAAFQALLAPPSRPALTDSGRTGAKVFEKLQCAVCHTPELTTAPEVEIPDPDSPFPTLHYVEVKALENQPVWLYSDLLLHEMGPELADGIVQGASRGGDWRTTPLWGLRYKKYYLHDGRARTIDQVILAHGGQAQAAKVAYARLPQKEKKDLLEFLSSL